jgi:hypothetical protein
MRASDVRISAKGLEVRTEGLVDQGDEELSAAVESAPLLDEAKSFMRYVLAYLESTSRRIQADETFLYGYWSTKFVRQGTHLAAWEHDALCAGFRAGITLAVTYWKEQHRTCESVGTMFLPPRAHQLVVVSDGVFQGESVQGVRYPSPEHMSGWWITTDRYDGRAESLKTEHLYHLTASRPELARLIALPYGYRFDQAHGQGAWFDQEVAQQVAE